MGKISRITWPQEYSELQRIDELLLCGICYDYMDTSVMTPCSHNYCSLCIRKYLYYKTQCPACFEKTFEKDLHTNRILDELISYFGKIREKLVDCISGAKVEPCEESKSVQSSPKFTPVRPARTNQNQKKSPLAKAEIEQSAVSLASPRSGNLEKFALLAAASPKVLSSPSTSGLSNVATIFTPKSKSKAAAGVSNGKVVPCPVCRVEVSEVHVNKHLDDCLKRETAIEPQPRTEPKRKPLPKLVFSLMKDAEMRKKMKELGLPSQGDRKTLEARFQRYSILYNAECDKREPRSIEELLKQCEDEENLEKKMLKFASAANRLKVTRNSEHNVIEEAQKKYLEANKQNYDNLIASIKNREKSKKPPVRRTLINQDEKGVTEEETTEKRVPENNLLPMNEDEEDEDRGPYSMNDYDNMYLDSDSSSCCPLQHYASDDPANVLAIQMANSNSNSPIATPSKSSPLKLRRSDEQLLNTHVSPLKNIKLNDHLPVESTSRNAPKDVYNLTTDSEDTDEDAVPPSPKAATRHSTKRPKLSLQQTQKTDDAKLKLDANKSEGQKLALSIARDFTFDSSSNDSVQNSTVHETADRKMTELPSAEAHNAEIMTTTISNRDKENQKSSSSNSSTVSRPVRKRNCVTRARKSDTIDLASSEGTPETTTTNDPARAARTDVPADETVESIPRIDSPLKRRRGRKSATPVEPDVKNPPRRPLRKRNTVIKERS